MNYPTLEEVNSADRISICRWYRFLSSPDSKERTAIMERIMERYKELGGFTPEISKEIGW
jgi:hypothetical protein